MATNDFVVKNGLDVTENAIIRETTDSSSKDTGALVVEGGVGIEKNLYVGVNLNVGGTTDITGNTTITGDLAVNGGDLTTNQTTFNLVETTATTLNVGGAATTLNLGAASGTTNVRNNLNVTGDLDIDGGDLTSSTSSFNLINTNATTLNIGGAATALTLGATTGTLTVRNTQAVFNSTNSIQIPVGTTAQRPNPLAAGQIRYNSELSTFEGYGPGNSWVTMIGVRDVDGNTYIIPETSPGANNNRLDFYANGTFALSLDSTTLDVKSGTALVVSNATESSSTTTGSVQIAGGVGIAKRLYAGSIENTPIGTSVRNTALFTTLGANGQVTFNAGTVSTTTGTGSLVVTGGVGISGGINTGTSSTFAGLSSTSTTTLSPSNASVTISPTGTGTVTIAPATAGTINNMSIGATTRAAGNFTTLDANSTVGLSPSNASVTISPTGTGTVTIAPATAGTINNMSIGATTATTGRFTTVTSTVSTGTAPFTVASTTVVTNLNADLLDGLNSTSASTASTIVARDSSGDINVRLVRSEFADQSTISGAMAFRTNNSSDNYIRFCSDTAAIRTYLDVPTRSGGQASGTWGISITGNAATLGSYAETAFLRYRGSITETTAGDTTTNATRTSGWYTVGYPGASDALLDIGGIGGSTPRVQFRFNYADEMYFRAARDSETGWDSVAPYGNRILHSNNYNSFSPTLTGGGASGTWGINITGNAATVSDGMYLSSTQTVTGIKYFQSNLGTTLGSLANAPLQAYATGSNAAFMSFHRSGSYAVNMGLDSDNVLRIGGWSAAANRLQLDMSGNLTIAGTFTESSSIRYKENIKPIDSALEKVLQLQGVTYDRKDGSGTDEPGLIAEEVLKVIPNLVTYDVDGNVEGLHYTKITAYLIECIKTLNAKIETLESKLNG